MAIAITDRKWLGTAEQIKAVLDADEDLQSLTGTYAPGSTAVVADGGKTYMVNASGNWKVARDCGGSGGSAGVEIIELGAQMSAALVQGLLGMVTAISPGRIQADNAIMSVLSGDFSGMISGVLTALERGKMPVFLVAATEGLDYPMSLIPTSVSLDPSVGITFKTSFSQSIPDGEGNTVYHTWLFTVIVLGDQARLICRRLDSSSY